jgi:transposase
MFELNASRAVYLHREPIDFRKNINGLASLVEHALGMNAFANAVFVFGNRRRILVAAKATGRCPLYLAAQRQQRH